MTSALIRDKQGTPSIERNVNLTDHVGMITRKTNQNRRGTDFKLKINLIKVTLRVKGKGGVLVQNPFRVIVFFIG